MDDEYIPWVIAVILLTVLLAVGATLWSPVMSSLSAIAAALNV